MVPSSIVASAVYATAEDWAGGGAEGSARDVQGGSRVLVPAGGGVEEWVLWSWRLRLAAKAARIEACVTSSVRPTPIRRSACSLSATQPRRCAHVWVLSGDGTRARCVGGRDRGRNRDRASDRDNDRSRDNDRDTNRATETCLYKGREM